MTYCVGRQLTSCQKPNSSSVPLTLDVSKSKYYPFFWGSRLVRFGGTSGGRQSHGHGDIHCSTSLVIRGTPRGDMSQILFPLNRWKMYHLFRRGRNAKRLTGQSTCVVMMKRNAGARQPAASLRPSATLRAHPVIPLRFEPLERDSLGGTQTSDRKRRVETRGRGIKAKLSYSWPLSPACTRITVTCQDRRLRRGGNGRMSTGFSNGCCGLRGREKGIKMKYRRHLSVTKLLELML